MTREEAKELLPIIQEFADGKTIQIYDDVKEGWRDIDFEDPRFDCIPSYYRIKQEPKYRPFKNKEECWQEMQKHQPFGWVKKNGNYVNITKVSDESYYDVGLKNLTFVDGAPFGIKED